MKLKQGQEINLEYYSSNEHEPEKRDVEEILCNYCLRSPKNSKRCLGICVADSEY